MAQHKGTSNGNLVQLWASGVCAAVAPHGAQLMSLKTAAGDEVLWHGNPAIWPDRAPILFPVIGPVTDGVIRHGGGAWPMPAHGFAQAREFTVRGDTRNRAVFELHADEGTRAHYPFDFLLRVAYNLTPNSLTSTISVTNEGDDPIFLTAEEHPTPVDGSVLRLRDDLFVDNAMVFDRIASHALTYGPLQPGSGARLRIEYPDSPYLAIWSRPGAPFTAIEPWQGLPSPVGFAGDLIDKPGIAVLQPGETRSWRLHVAIVNPREEPDALPTSG